MSELFDKEVNAQKESLKNNFRGSRKLPHAHKKVCDENETKIKIRCTRKNVFGGRRTQLTGENDLYKQASSQRFWTQ